MVLLIYITVLLRGAHFCDRNRGPSRTRDQSITLTEQLIDRRIFAVFIAKCSILLCLISPFYLEGRYSTRNALLSWIRFSLKRAIIIIRDAHAKKPRGLSTMHEPQSKTFRKRSALSQVIVAEQLTTGIRENICCLAS